jgi:uncharacterized membrane protein
LDPHDLALAYALSTIAGLRASLTIAAISLAVHLHWLAPPDALHWLASDATLAIASVLAAAEFLADKIPVVDHALHVVHVFLAPVAGGTAALAADPSNSDSGAIVTAVLAGSYALAIHGLRSAARAASSAISLGALNPLASLGEDAIAIGVLTAAFFAPITVAAIVLLVTAIAVMAVRRMLAAAKARSTTAVLSP